MNRALRAATMGVLLLAPVALTACSSGQVTQTASQDRDRVGGSARVGEISLRQALLVYPEEGEGRYGEGENAELTLAIANSGVEDDTLVSIEGDGFDGVFVDEVPDESSATPSASPSATPTGTAGPQPSTPTSEAPSASTRVDVPIPADDVVFIGPPASGSGSGDGVRIFLADLAEELTVGQTIELTLTFDNAGSVTVTALVATPAEALERDESEAFDFHHEEEAAAGEAAGTDEAHGD